MQLWVLEVQRFESDGHTLHPEWNGKFEHIGYMNKLFKTKQEACDYYNGHNQHMRSLNAHSTWCSDWDPTNNLRYVVRTWQGEYTKVDSFDNT